MKRLLLCFLALSLSLPAISQNIPNTITLATTNWCPYACENSPNKPGIIVEYLTSVLAQQGVKLEIEFHPWHESVNKANLGETDGLLTAIKTEAPSLLFTETPTAHYQVCFITKNDSNWLYKGLESLTDIKLGSINGYGYGDSVDQYIKRNLNTDYLKIFETNNSNELNKALFANEIGAYLEDSLVVLWGVRRTEHKVKLAGCLDRKPFFLAINPNREWANAFIAIMNNALSDNISLQQLNAVLQRYR